jgi:hypothetical protein
MYSVRVGDRLPALLSFGFAHSISHQIPFDDRRKLRQPARGRRLVAGLWIRAN